MSGALITPPNVSELPVAIPTVASLLKGIGYATAHFGKWHVGRTNPSAYGFDVSDGPTNNGGPLNVQNPNPVQSYGITERAVNFIRQQVQVRTPFYVQISHYAGKSAADVRPETWTAARGQMIGQSDNVVGMAASTLEMDNTIRLLQKALDSLGVIRNTYIVFWSDHGQQSTTYNAPLSYGKGTIWEGGVRIPFFIAGPGIAASSISRVQASATDLMPTIMDLVGTPIGQSLAGVEGGSLKSVLLGNGIGSVSRRYSDFVVHFPHYDFDPIGPASSIVSGRYKLIRSYEDNTLRLYDLLTDLEERSDVSRVLPTKTVELNAKLTDYLTSVGAQYPRRP